MSIRAVNLSHIYSAGTVFEKAAVRDVNFEIKRGSFVAIVGHTGSGKSTLIQHFNALMVPTSGTVFLDGYDINSDKSKLKELRRRVGLVFQYPEHQLFEVTVSKDVAFGPENMGLSKEEVAQRVNDSLKLVGIPEDIYEKSPFELSGGQKRRVAIAGVLAMRPDVLVLDEPTAGLDPKGREEILERVKLMHEQLKITVILVSHNMEDVARLAERVIVMHGGQVAFSGTPAEVFSEPERLEKIGLAAPQISYFAAELNKRGISLGNGIITVPLAVEALKRVIPKL